MTSSAYCVRIMLMGWLFLGAAVHAANASQPGVDRLAQEYTAWSEPAWCALLQDRQAIVRVTASLLIEARVESQEGFSCPQYRGPGALSALRLQALRDGWDDPATVSFIYATHCTLGGAGDRCDIEAVQRRFVELDPGNAFAHLLLLGERGPAAKTPEPFTAQEKAQLRRAAQAEFYREYLAAGLHDTYRAFVAAQSASGPLTLSPAAVAALPTGHRQVTELWRYLAAVDVFGVFLGSAVPAYAGLSQGCRLAQTEGDAAAVADCLAVADLMSETAQTYLAQKIGSHMRHGLTHPEFAGAAGAQQDPERWRRQLFSIVQFCEQQRGLEPMNSDLPGPMPPSHLDEFLADFQAHGERVANLKASTREYERYPSVFALAPARCQEILDLDVTVQRELAGQWKSAFAANGDTTGKWQQVVRQAAIALNRPDS